MAEQIDPKVERGFDRRQIPKWVGIAAFALAFGTDFVANIDSGEWVPNGQFWDPKQGFSDFWGNVGLSEISWLLGLAGYYGTREGMKWFGAYGQWKTTTPRSREMVPKVTEGTPVREFVKF